MEILYFLFITLLTIFVLVSVGFAGLVAYLIYRLYGWFNSPVRSK